jgi:hypothetical protein
MKGWLLYNEVKPYPYGVELVHWLDTDEEPKEIWFKTEDELNHYIKDTGVIMMDNFDAKPVKDCDRCDYDNGYVCLECEWIQRDVYLRNGGHHD